MATPAQILAIYQTILAEIPEGWFDPENLKQDPSNPGTNRSIIASLLWAVSVVLSAAQDALDYTFTRFHRSQAQGDDLHLLYGSIYGVPAMVGETDDAYRARTEALVFRPKKTRAAIRAAVEEVLGVPPLLIVESAVDSWYWGRSFWGYHYISKRGRGETLLVLQGPIRSEQLHALCAGLRNVMPATHLTLEVRH